MKRYLKHYQWAVLGLLFYSTLAWSQKPVITVHIRHHLFYPSNVSVPVNTKVKLLIINEDATAEEFESYALNREKLIAGKQKAHLFIGPLPAGTYQFFGEFNPHTAQGIITVK